MPKGPSGAAPSLGLSYSSGGQDGMTSGTNNQGSWVGDGWNFTPGGFVDRHFWTCSEDPSEDGRNNKEKTGDQCWGPDNATLVLGGKSTELIKIDDTHWKPLTEDGSTVERLVANPGDKYKSEYWVTSATRRVTSPGRCVSSRGAGTWTTSSTRTETRCRTTTSRSTTTTA
ncbi:hypothetical protein ACFQ1S_24820 [Kibdelosporangium lantanae]|uniref:Ricin B lectin domain-containing protein n=1 Tax=Kibdelosporangium lantanae TaxID=1497396 RepID=A0ABW3MEF5_9PSEU